MIHFYIGRDMERIRAAVRTEIAKHFADPIDAEQNTHLYFASDVEWEELERLLQTVNPFADKTVFEVHGIKAWGAKTRPSLPKALQAFAKRPFHDAVLLLIEASEPQSLYPLRNEAVDLAKRHAGVHCHIMDTIEEKRWLQHVEKTLADKGHTLSAEARAFLTEHVDAKATEIQLLSDALLSLAGSEPATLSVSDVARCMTDVRAESLQDLVDRILARDLKGAMATLSNLRAHVRDMLQRSSDFNGSLVSELARSFIWLYQFRARGRNQKGFPLWKQVVPGYMQAPHRQPYLRSMEQMASNWTFDAIEDALLLLCELDLALKSNSSERDRAIVVEQTIASLVTGSAGLTDHSGATWLTA